MQRAHALRGAAGGLATRDRPAHGLEVQTDREVLAARGQDDDACLVVGGELGDGTRQLVPERRAHGVPPGGVGEPER